MSLKPTLTFREKWSLAYSMCREDLVQAPGTIKPATSVFGDPKLLVLRRRSLSSPGECSEFHVPVSTHHHMPREVHIGFIKPKNQFCTCAGRFGLAFVRAIKLNEIFTDEANQSWIEGSRE